MEQRCSLTHSNTRWRWVVTSCHGCFTSARESQYLLNRRLGVPQSWSGCFWRTEKYLVPIEVSVPGCSVYSIVANQLHYCGSLDTRKWSIKTQFLPSYVHQYYSFPKVICTTETSRTDCCKRANPHTQDLFEALAKQASAWDSRLPRRAF
jgi:hypothetical protein